LAKVASDINKPNGIYVILPTKVASFIDEMPLNKIPGVGKITFEKLKEHQLVYGKDVKVSDEASLIKQFGKLGKLLWLRCHGIDEREIVTSRARKSVGVERTFATDIDDLSILKEILFQTLLPELKTRAAKH